MKNFSLILGSLVLAISAVSTSEATTYAGNQSTGFGGQIGPSTLTVTNNSAGLITFSLACPNAINNVAFYLSTGATGIADTSSLTDIGDAGRRTISGVSTSTQDGTANTPNLRSPVTFATGFAPSYAIAIDGAGNGNLFKDVNTTTTGILDFTANLGETVTPGTGTAVTYTFTLNPSTIGLTIANGSSLKFVATLGNGSDGSNGNNFYRSNETIGASNADNNAVGNLANTGALTYTGSDTYTLSGVPEPSTWMMAATGITLLGGWRVMRRQHRLVALKN